MEVPRRLQQGRSCHATTLLSARPSASGITPVRPAVSQRPSTRATSGGALSLVLRRWCTRHQLRFSRLVLGSTSLSLGCRARLPSGAFDVDIDPPLGRG